MSGAAPADGCFVGVDVVDLADPRCAGKAADERFLARVLAEDERAGVALAAGDPDRALWRLWSAKEAAYKVISKLRGAPPPFVHASYRVQSAGERLQPGFGRVTWEDLAVRVHWHEADGRIAALGWNGPAGEEPVEWGWATHAEIDPDPAAPVEALVTRLSERERRAVHSRGSALVRLAARGALAQALGVEEERLEVVCGDGPKGRMPPEALLDGAPAPADVSLSHHGRWLAWAVRLVPAASHPRPEPEEDV